jgi:hypothetical protein
MRASGADQPEGHERTRGRDSGAEEQRVVQAGDVGAGRSVAERGAGGDEHDENGDADGDAAPERGCRRWWSHTRQESSRPASRAEPGEDLTVSDRRPMPTSPANVHLLAFASGDLASWVRCVQPSPT